MVKICSNCGQKLHENTQLCPDCGGTEFTLSEGDIQGYKINNKVFTRRDMTGNGNIGLGVLGGFLLSLVGVAIFFAVYQIGFITGIAGAIIFYLAGFGYKKFSGCYNRVSTAGLITSITLTILMVFIAYYISYAFDCYLYCNEAGLSYIEMLLAIPDYLQDPDMYSWFVGDLVYSYAFAFIAVIWDIVRIIRYR